MNRQSSRAWRAAWALVAMAGGLAACGGGGGGAAPAPAPPPVAATGLVPEAPTPGAVLVQDATTLRVLRPGAVWRYRGTYGDVGQPSSAARVYSNDVTHAAAGAGVTEQATNSLNGGADSSTVRFVGADVHSPQVLNPAPAVSESVDAIELRSPVRPGDQYTQLDKHYADAGADLDGDGRNDAVDVALYTRVIGEEVLDLHHRPQVHAVRVDTTLRERVKYSKDGHYGDVVEAVQSIWYAAGLGVVRLRVEVPNDVQGGARQWTQEDLLSWDGLTQGLGPMPSQVLMEQSGAIDYPLAAVGLDDHALAMRYIGGEAQIAGISLLAVDASGRTTASTDWHGTQLFGETMTPQTLLRAGSQVRLLALLNDGIALAGFSGDGRQQTLPGRRAVVRPQFSVTPNAEVLALSAAGRIWIVWMEGYDYLPGGSSPVTNLYVQSFDFSGEPLSAPTKLEASVNPNTIMQAALAGGDDRVVVSYQANNAGAVNNRWAVFDAGSGALVARQSDTPVRFDSPDPYVPILQPVDLQPGLAFVAASRGAQTGVAAANLAGDGSLVLAAGATIESERVLQQWTQPLLTLATPLGDSGRLYLASWVVGTLWPEDSGPSNYAVVSELVPGAGALSSTGVPRLLVRLPLSDIASGFPVYTVPLADRLLIIGVAADGHQSVRVTPVWR